MKNNYFTLNRCILFACMFYACISSLSAQVKNDFDVRYQDNVRGELTFIANNIVNRDSGNNNRPEDPYNSTGNSSSYNDNLNMQYIDVDSDGSTFSSSSASLSIPDPSCSRIAYAGLYWSAVYKDRDRSDFNQVKFKVPGGSYVNLTADEILFDGYNDSDFGSYSPYACYKDVTSLLTPLASPDGEYFVANVRASSGSSISGGISGGWTLVIVYENPTLAGKYITTFDGYAGIKSRQSVDIPYDGFITLPKPFPVNAKMAVATLEGDNRITGDKLSIKSSKNNSFTTLGNSANPKDNFFNSNITIENSIVNTRNPNSRNTLGWDVDLFTIDNPNNKVIPNDETAAVLRASSTQDKYDIFFSSFSVEVIEPDMQLAKNVFDIDNNDIQGKEVALGEEIKYTLSFDNIGNDDGTNFSIKDILPKNVNLLSVNLPDAIGVNSITYTHDPVSNEIIFSIPDIYAEVDRSLYTITINVQVQEDCDKLRDACSNIIQNLAYASYRGVLNDNEISEDPSVSGFDNCNFGIPGSTNFLPNLDECNFEREIAMCGDSVDLIAGEGFDTYQWFFQNPDGTYRALTGVIEGSNANIYTATNFGKYKVEKKITEPCKDFDEFITVIPRSNNLESPFADVADEIVTCTNDGTQLPKFFLCGTNDDRNLNVSFPDAIELVWQKVDESCAALSDVEDCPTRDNSCTWNTVGTGDQYLLDGPGEYRLEVRYQNNCFNRFYFKSYENSVDPKIAIQDIICETQGKIEISGVGNGYEYAIGLASSAFNSSTAAWQTTTSFTVNVAGTYNVYIRQEGIDINAGDREPCLFKFENVIIADRAFDVSATPKNALCFDDKGSINVTVDDARAWYTYVLTDSDGDIVAEERQTDDNNFVFVGLDPGDYKVKVTTIDKCEDIIDVTLTAPTELKLNAVIDENVACNDGKISLTASGGTPSYSYAIWSYVPAASATASAISYSDIDDIPASEYDINDPNDEFIISQGAEGKYIFLVTDKNNCNTFSNEVTIAYNPPITWSLERTNLGCFQSNDGIIKVNHGSKNGYSLTYVLTKPDGSTVNSSDGNFTGLAAGRNYEVTVTQSYGSQTCSTSDKITLTEPDRLTASAGVSKLPGCNSSDETLAEVRITNPLGGTPPYTYSFDNGSSYGNSAIGNLSANTHTLYVKDSEDCTFQMTVTIPKLPVEPTAEVTYTYNCDGSGNIVLTPSVPDYEYDYDVNGVPTDSGSTLNVNDLPNGEHTITIHYNNPNYVTYSNLLNEDFGQGANTSSPYIDPKYCYESQYPNDPSSCDPGGTNNREINDGEYSVTSKIDPGKGLFLGWISPNDHTDPTNPNGRYMAINIGGVAGVNGVIFKKRVYDVVPNQDISVELEAFNLIGEGTTNRDDPFLVIQLVGTDGAVIAETNTDRIPRHIDANTWINYAVELNPGNNDELDIVIRTQNDEVSGNDIAIDDILAYQVPEKCDLTVDIDIIIDGEGFAANLNGVTDASCSGENEGVIEFEVENFDTTEGFQYSIDNGVTWSTTQTSSPLKIENLPAGSYNVQVRDVRDTANCVADFDATIEMPDPITVSANVTSQMTCSNNYTAVITAKAEGGVGVYEYQLENTGGIVTAFQANNKFTITGIANAGDYTITVKDENGCVSPVEANVTVNPPKTVDFDLSAVECYNGKNGEITVTVKEGNGNYQFSLDNSTWRNASAATPLLYTFNNLTPGTYNVYVKDGSGCSETKQIKINEQLSLSVSSQTNISCFEDADGAATITVEYFETSYSYTLDGGAPVLNLTSPSFDISSLTTGNHQVVVSDGNGCSEEITVSIEEPTAKLTSSIVVKDITCTNSGSVKVTAENGWGSYSYLLESTDGTISVGPQSNRTFNNLTVETDYIVTTIDAGGCESKNPFTLKKAALPEVTVAATSDLCYADGGVSLTATATGGLAPYQYKINGGAYQTANVFNNLTPGSYTVEVTDANGCSATSSTPIVINDKIAANANLIKDLDCSATNDAEIEVTITDGYPGYTYQVLLDGASQGADAAVTSNPFTYTTTSVGSYTFLITDTEGCTVTTNAVVVTENTPATVNPLVTEPLCSDSTDGVVELQISGGNAPYSIVFNGGTASSQTKYAGLAAGTYAYTVTDDKGCVTSGNVTVNAPDPIIPGTVSLVTDYRCDNSSATIQLTGYSGGTPGTTGYQFSIDGNNFQTSDTFSTGITAGTYTITVKDENGCEATASITIDPLNKPTKLDFTATALTCPAVQADVEVSVVGGNTPFNYEITAPSGSVVDNGTNNIFSNLAVGTYTFKVTDAKGCEIVDTFTINDIPRVAVRISDSSDVICNGASDGEFIFEVSDFVTTYSYDVTDGASTSIDSNTGISTATNTISNLSAGTYTVTVTDETTNCTVDTSITIKEPVALDFGTTITDVTCLTNGSITVNATDGWGSYEYQLSDAAGTTVIKGYQKNNTFTNIAAGTYTVFVKDGKGCEISKPITLDPATPPSIAIETSSIVCYDSTNRASLDISVTGGIAPFTYTINGGESNALTLTGGTFTISDLLPGTYNIEVIDAYGCTSSAVSTTIETQLSASSLITKSLDCTASPNAEIQVTLTGGYTPYAVYEVSTDGGSTWPVSNTFTGNMFTYNPASEGTYLFKITDAQGCEVTTQKEIAPISTPVISNVIPTNVTCNGSETGSLEVQIDNSVGVSPYTIEVFEDDGAGNPVNSKGTQTTNLPAGEYIVIITDAKGCESAPFNVEITELAPIAANAVKVDITCGGVGVGMSLGSITIDATGGTAPFTYEIRKDDYSYSDSHNTSLSSNSHIFDNLNYGDYIIRVEDANGCDYTETITVGNPPNLILSASTIPACLPGTGIMTVEANTTDGNLTSGDFYFATYPNVDPFSPTSSNWYKATDDPKNLGFNTAYTFTNLDPGVSYTFIVHDANTGCEFVEEASVDVAANSSLVAIIDAQSNVTCVNGGDGSVTFTVDPSSTDATSINYEIYDNNNYTGTAITGSTTEGVATTQGGLAPGEYYIYFEEIGGTNSGCSNASDTFIINESPRALELTAAATNDNCATNAGVITATAKYGTAPYEYQFLDRTAAIPSATDGGWTTNSTANVEAGDYTVYVKDANNCIKEYDVSVLLDTTPTISATTTNQCTAAESNFNVTLTLGTEGVAPYYVSVDGGAFIEVTNFTSTGSTQGYSLVTSGTHIFEIKDSNGCGEIISTEVYAPLDIEPSITASETCVPGNSGEVTITVAGGSGNFSFELIETGATNTTGIFTGLDDSTSYNFNITDVDSGCTEQTTITLPTPVAPTFALVGTDISCNAGNDGTITVNLNPGNVDVPYTYTYALKGSVAGTPVASNHFDGLEAGTYEVTVISNKGCQTTKEITLGEPSQLAITASASAYTCDESASVVTVNILDDASGNPSGTGPYLYSYDGGATFKSESTFSVAYGSPSVSVVVKDANGCEDDVSVTIPAMQKVTASISTKQGIDCSNGEEIISIDVIGGSTNYTYTELPNGTPVADPTNIVITSPGKYVYEVYDTTTNCSAIVEHTVAPYDLIGVTVEVTVDETCSNSNDGEITVTVTGYTGTFSYQILDSAGGFVSGGSGNETATSDPYTFIASSTLDSGIYSVQITETETPLCSEISNKVTIDAPEEIALQLISNTNANCNESNAIVTVQATGGTAPYTYEAVAQGAGEPNTFTSDNTLELDPATPSWDIYVKDSKGCIVISPLNVNVATETIPDITLSLVDECAVEGAFSIEATLTDAVNVGVPPYRISLNGAPFQNVTAFPVVFSGLKAQLHSVEIKDINGCGETETLTILPELKLSASVNTQPICGTGGIIDYTVSGGSGTNTVELFKADGTGSGITATGSQFTAVPEGNYIVRVTDGTTNCSKEQTISLEAPTPVDFNLDKKDISCHDATDGSIEVLLDASNDQPPYTYNLYEIDALNGNLVSGGVVATQTGNNTVFTNLPAGFYRVITTSNRSCEDIKEIEIINPPALAISAAVTDSCDPINGYDITVTLTDIGTPPYSLTVNGAVRNVTFETDDTYEIHGLNPGNHTIGIIDANGCSYTTATAITIVPLNFSAQVTTLLDCEMPTPAGNAVITVADIAGSGDYDYSIVGPNGVTGTGSASANTFTWNGASEAGDYIITVTDTNVGCAIEKTVNVPEKLFPQLSITKEDVTCYQAENGSITVAAIDNGTGPFTFEITDIDGLTVSVAPDNTAPSYEATFSDLKGTEAGTSYTVTATSTTNACTETISEIITQPTEIVGLTASVDQFTCTPSTNINSIAKVIATAPIGGTGNFRYEFVYDNGTPSDLSDDKTQNSTRLEYLVSNPIGGEVTVSVFDENGCSPVSTSVTIDPYVGLDALTTNVIQPTCNTGDGEITVNAVLESSIGSANFIYEIRKPDGSTEASLPVNADNYTFSGLNKGNYVLTVTNVATGCQLKTTAALKDPNTFEVEVEKIQDVLCFDSETGIVDVKLIDATYTGNFTWSIYNAEDDSFVKSGNQTDNSGINLFAGAYYVEVSQTDTPFCSNRAYFTINQSEKPLTLDAEISKFISCTDSGEITASATGGYGFFEYQLVDDSNGNVLQSWSEDNVFESLSAGTYNVYVRDYEGCDNVFTTLLLEQPNTIAASAIQADVIQCEGETTASITVNSVTGGRPEIDPSANYLYILNILDASGTIVSSNAAQTSNTFTGLQEGNYSVTVTDNHGCDSDTNPVTITAPNEVVSALRIDKNNTCNTGATLELTASGGTGSGYEYSTSANGPWVSMGGNSINISVPQPITTEVTHQYFVRDGNQCISDVSNAVVTKPIQPIKITPTVVTDVSCYAEATGFIKVDVAGGLGDYLYTLYDVSGSVVVVPQQEENTFSNLPAGVYYVGVESGDCIAEERVQIEEGNELTSKEPVITNPMCSDDLGRIELELQGGTGEYQYAISPNLDQFQSKNVFEDLEPGTYTIIAQDSKGCNPFVYKKEIKAPKAISAKANILEKEFCQGDKTGSFEINIEGGTAPYYTALNTQDDDKFELSKTMFEGLEGGETYVVFIKDANGCSTNVIVTLDKSVDLSPKAEVNLTCLNNSSANEVEITLAQEGLEEIIYKMDDGEDQFENVFKNVAPGEHTVTVSYFGCERKVDFTVDAIDPLNLAVGQSNINQFTIEPSGGSAPYEYFIDGVSNGSDPEYVIRETGTYQVKVIDANGCEVMAQIAMTFIDIDIPNVFTPDGDNNNDTWTPGNTLLYPNIVTKIYDRYGRVIAELRIGDEWDGTYNGSLLPTGDYWYVIKLNGASDDREFVGHFTLYR
ncbi:T9SS type B sorting domain-containing protein [Joostella atrarenae]|uniref:T9SS type B sorting domain-containing protein n=1 Tax=Joostella atrarenae TaxID=679257 RepID=A0ABS9IZM9_9FLAO|nr:T9SS type B sorting domain-containing protein [Joostella atrarenae]MCF8713629.1 T9SS type B sorting domain-containing protein [Joostella atrarenae]